MSYATQKTWSTKFPRGCRVSLAGSWTTTTTTVLCFMDLYPGLPGWSGTRRNIHPLTYRDHHPTFISFFHLLRSIASCLFNLQSFCTTSVQVLFGPPLGLEPSTSYSIHFFTHTISACFAVVPRLYHLFLVSLNSFLGTLSFTLTSHIHLTILISARWSATLFFRTEN